MEETTKLLKTYVGAAPTENQAVIKNIIDHPMVVSLMATKNKLDSSMAEKIQTEMILILLGLEPISRFRANLVSELETSYDQALKIAFDANAQFFGPVMETLKQMDDEIKKFEEENAGSEEETENQSPSEPRSGVETHPNRMIPDHEEMEKVDGIHLHSQSVMPMNAAAAQKESRNFTQTPKQSFSSTIDQKLRNIVRSPTTTNQAGNPEIETMGVPVKTIVKPGYVSNDPYREPL